MTKIVWTRAKDRWDEDRDLFPKGLQVEHIPLIDHIVNLTEQSIRKKSHVLVSSGLAAEIILGNENLLKQIKECQVFTFSHRVEQVLASLVQRVEADSMQQLLDILIEQAFIPNTPIYFLGADVPAFPVAAHLKELGFNCVEVALYKTLELDSLDRKQIKILEESCVICLASPSSTHALARLCEIYHLDASVHHVVAIGRTTEAEAVKYFKNTRVSDQPSLESMLKTAEDWALEL